MTTIHGREFLLGLATLFAAATTFGQAKDFTGHQIVSVQISNDVDVQKLYALESASEDFDIWSEGIGIGPVLARVSPVQRALLDASGLPYRVVIQDIQPLLAVQRSGTPGFFDDFRTNDELNAHMGALIAQYPQLASPVVFGQSIEGRSIQGIRVTGPGTNKPGVLIHGCQHAREWLTPQTVLYVAEHLLTQYQSDSNAKLLVDNIEWYILPVANPDGYIYTWTTDRFWRKNRRGGYGVDLNRNWGYQWGGEGSSPVTSSEIYRGTSAFSEPETQALRDFLLTHPNVRGHVDIHSFSTLLMWPWSYTAVVSPDESTFRRFATVMRDLAANVHGLIYTIGPAYTTIYPASGASIDWVYGAEHRWSVTFELRGTNFVVPPSYILLAAEENLPTLLYFGSWIAACDPVGASLGYSRASAFPDCDSDDLPDVCEITDLTDDDCNLNLLSDTCDFAGGFEDCNTNGEPDDCDIVAHGDCNGNGQPDDCDIATISTDRNGDDVPDECEGSCCECGPCSDRTPQECSSRGGIFGGLNILCGEANSCVSPLVDHDFCSQAFKLPSAPQYTTFFDNRCATSDLPAQIPCPVSTSIGADLWYTYKAPCTGTVEFSTCDTTNFDGVLAIFGTSTTCSCPSGSTSPISCEDDSCGLQGGPPVITRSVVSGRCYTLRLGGWQSSIGTGDLKISYLTACNPTDLNASGKTDLRDFAMLENCFGPSRVGCTASDFNSDGVIDTNDYRALHAMLGL